MHQDKCVACFFFVFLQLLDVAAQCRGMSNLQGGPQKPSRKSLPANRHQRAADSPRWTQTGVHVWWGNMEGTGGILSDDSVLFIW